MYRGPGAVPGIKSELTALLKADGFSSVAEAVGADHRVADSGSGSNTNSDKKKKSKKGRFWR